MHSILVLLLTWVPSLLSAAPSIAIDEDPAAARFVGVPATTGDASSAVAESLDLTIEEALELATLAVSGGHCVWIAIDMIDPQGNPITMKRWVCNMNDIHALRAWIEILPRWGCAIISVHVTGHP